VRFAPVDIVVIVVDVGLCLSAEPAIGLLLVHVLQGNPRGEHDVVVVEDILESVIDHPASEEGLPKFGVQEVHEEGVEGHSGYLVVLEFGRLHAQIAQGVEKLGQRSAMENASLGNAPESSFQVHSENGVFFDGIFELVDRFDEVVSSGDAFLSSLEFEVGISGEGLFVDGFDAAVVEGEGLEFGGVEGRGGAEQGFDCL
jgi:hypothetical protein